MRQLPGFAIFLGATIWLAGMLVMSPATEIGGGVLFCLGLLFKALSPERFESSFDTRRWKRPGS